MAEPKPPRRSRPTFTRPGGAAIPRQGRPGKLEVVPTKPMATQRDLSLAYSPGVAVPVLAIAEDPDARLRLHRQGQPGRGDLQRHRDPRPRQSRRARLQAGDGGQGGAVQALRRRRFHRPRGRHRGPGRSSSTAVRYLGPTFGGINLEDIKAPECFIIEERLRELMDIPVFHDDQHGTAIIAAAGLINALQLTGRDIDDDEARRATARARRASPASSSSRRWASRPTTSSSATPRASSTRAAPRA